MFVPLIFTALLPINPALFMRELICWAIGVFLDTFDDSGTRTWIRENPKDKSALLVLLGSLVMIEDMISCLTLVRARQMLGHRPGRARKGRRTSYHLTGHPHSLEEIERRFQRLDAVEKNADHLAVRIARMLTNAVSQLGRVHHPVEPTSTTTTIFRQVRQKSSTPMQTAGQRIRAPPWPDASCENPISPHPQALTCETAPACPEPRPPPPVGSFTTEGSHAMAKNFRPDISPDDIDGDQAENKKQLGNPEPGSAHWPSAGKDEADNALSEKHPEKKSTIKAQRDERPGG